MIISIFSNAVSSASSQLAKYKSNLNSQGLKNLQNTQLGDVAYSRVSNLADKLGLGSYLPTKQLGSFGSIVFTASMSQVRTFDEFSRNVSNRTASHDVIGQKPILEYLGPGADEISFSMTFNAMLGVDPLKESEAIIKLCKEGTAEFLVINGKPFSTNKFVISSVSEAAKTWDNRGRVLSSTVSVTLKESPSLPQVVTVTKNADSAATDTKEGGKT